MWFANDNKSFFNTFKYDESDSEMRIKNVILSECESENIDIKPLIQWVQSGFDLYKESISHKQIRTVAALLKKQRVPYFILEDNLYIRDYTEEKMVLDNILSSLAVRTNNFVEECSIKEFRRHCMDYSLMISGLSDQEIFTALKIAGNYLSGDMVSSAEFEDGTYALFFSLNTVRSGKVGQIITRTILETSGIYSEKDFNIRKNDKDFDDFCSHINQLIRQNSYYIYCSGSDLLILIDSLGYEFCRLFINENGAFDFTNLESCDSSEPYFLISFFNLLDKFESPAATKSLGEVIRNFKGLSSSLDFTRDDEELSSYEFKYALSNLLYETVIDHVNSRTENRAVHHYITEEVQFFLDDVITLLDDAIVNQAMLRKLESITDLDALKEFHFKPVCSKNFTRNDVDRILSLAEEYGESLMDYKPAIARLREIELSYRKYD